jgi:hypothetical protein
MFQEFEVGLLISPEEGLSFFGIEIVNDLLLKGAKVLSLEPGGAILESVESENDNENVEVTITGFNIKVRMEILDSGMDS